MTKGKKKTNRRLKKTVRKTLGTLFLISAIIVAAILRKDCVQQMEQKRRLRNLICNR